LTYWLSSSQLRTKAQPCMPQSDPLPNSLSIYTIGAGSFFEGTPSRKIKPMENSLSFLGTLVRNTGSGKRET
jgi:hypothetical protein